MQRRPSMATSALPGGGGAQASAVITISAGVTNTGIQYSRLTAGSFVCGWFGVASSAQRPHRGLDAGALVSVTFALPPLFLPLFLCIL